jgi:predicted AAA+ superfamily ATPase
MYIPRLISNQLVRKLKEDRRVIILYGARQVGKSTLVQHILPQLSYRTLSVDAQERKYLDVLSSTDVDKIKSLVSGYDLVVIDEAQQIPNIGINLKLIHDHIPQIKVLVTGSSSFDLSNKISEPLTGRYWSYVLYPISIAEIAHLKNNFALNQQLENRLIFGSYPEIFNIQSYSDRKEYLNKLCSSYLFKDILQIAHIKNSNKLNDLLKLLAFQVGQEVSLSELGIRLNMSKDTISHYIDLLEKTFVVFRVRGLSRNLRKEVYKMNKIYFYDLGIRNSIIDTIKPLNERNDVGQLWENFMMIERLKQNAYSQHNFSSYFWRLHTGAEIDYIEEAAGIMHGYEFKWNTKKSKCPKSWSAAYPGSTYEVINQENYLSFVGVS